MRGPLRAALVALAALAALPAAPAPARAADPVDHVDAAAACRRRGKPACTLREADAALARLGPAGDAALAREALALRAEALALLDRPGDAADAFRALLERDPAWRPAPDADPRVRDAAEAARRARLLAALPDRLDPGPPPLPPAPTADALLPPPVLYAPRRLVELDPDSLRAAAWRLSLGGGVALLTRGANRRFDPGPVALLELSYDLAGPLAVWSQASLTLLSFDGSLDVEPGYGRGLTAAAGVVGLMVSIPVLETLDLVLAAGLGGGGFGARSAGEVSGLALQAVAGVRWQAERRLALRLDAVPQAVVPLGGGSVGAGGHVALALRAEVRF